VAIVAQPWNTTNPRVASTDEYLGKTVVGKYRIEQMLGEGGMGKVYKATQLGIDRPIVLKVLRQALLSDDRTVRRFQREAKAASRLNHPNSIGVIDFGTAEDGALYIAMEYVQGKDLHHVLSREWPLPEARIIRIVSQVLSALSDAHSAGVIHRDLKPENIMVEQRRGEADFVKVLDFGIAKIMDSAGDDGPALTRAGFVCGTPEYMSPEQARGAQLDHRSDLYAVGVILYQLCSGLLPFDSDSAVGFATKHLTEQPPPPSKRRPEARISPGLEKLIMRALAKSPDDRPQTAEAFRDELLALDKERRAAPVRSRGASGKSLPRVSTPEDQTATRVNGSAEPNPWENADATRRADSNYMRAQHDGPVPQRGYSDVTSAADKTRAGLPPDMTADMEPVTRKASRVVFIATASIIVVLALALAGSYVWQVTRDPDFKVVERPTPDPQPSPNPLPPVPLAPPEPTGPLWALQTPGAEPADAEGAKKLSSEGDKEWFAGRVDDAAKKYQLAFWKSPDPELALKLGEVYRVKKDKASARAWWDRHLKDTRSSAATSYINEIDAQ
jgi:eukaryotic-like serine/threonine-protein kinase